MRILAASCYYWPMIGGLERVTELLCRYFAEQGHEVRIATTTPDPRLFHDGIEIIRQPSVGEIIEQLNWCDVHWQNSLQARMAWPLIIKKKPTLLTHTRVYDKGNVREGVSNLKLLLKHWLRIQMTGVSISRVVADSISQKMRIIGNPYDEKIFVCDQDSQRSDLIFVGRLTSEKGVDLLIRALASLRDFGFIKRLKIVGSGEEEKHLKQLVSELKLNKQISFLGVQEGAELAQLLNESEVFVMPTVVVEGFGVAALDAAACGCLCVVPAESGAEEAAGPAALRFMRGDMPDLAKAIVEAFVDPRLNRKPIPGINAHLQRFHLSTIGELYLAEFERLLGVR